MVSRLPGGYNSAHYKWVNDAGKCFFVKEYPAGGADKRRRLQTEFKGMQFLWRNGCRQIPRPIAAVEKHRLAVYEYIEATALQSSQISPAVLRQILIFVRKLKRLGLCPHARYLAPASEACFTLRDYRVSLARRKRRLERVSDKTLHFFLKQRVLPVYQKMEKSYKDRVKRLGLNEKKVLPLRFRTLSQSDAGFHNIMKRRNGRLVFVDFEYFGWDDPVKLLCDFILQPDHPIPAKQVNYFRERFADIFVIDPDFKKRLKVIYPILWMKWCLIMLNCFFSPKGSVSLAGGVRDRRRQLRKAANCLKRLELELERMSA